MSKIIELAPSKMQTIIIPPEKQWADKFLATNFDIKFSMFHVQKLIYKKFRGSLWEQPTLFLIHSEEVESELLELC